MVATYSRRPKRITSALLAAGVFGSVLAAPVGTLGAQGATPCGVAPAGYNVIVSNAAQIVGTAGRDFICAGTGSNRVFAQGGNDIIFGRGGADEIFGGAGNDQIFGGSGTDRLFSGAGNDIVNGGNGGDLIQAGPGNDVIDAGAGTDIAAGNGGNDRLVGGTGRDLLRGGGGADIMSGGDDRDRIFGDDGNDSIGGGEGDDLLIGGNGRDRLVGGVGNDDLRGQGSPDELLGSGGDDILDGGNGLNVTVGGGGLDECFNALGVGTDCEILDGIDLENPSQTISATLPNEIDGLATISGQNWSPNPAFPDEVNIAVSVGALSGQATIVNGSWAVTAPIDATFGEQIVATNQSTTHTITQVLETFDYDPATQDLVVTGQPETTIRVLVFDNREELVLVEQITFDSAGEGDTNFSEVATIGSIDINRQDTQGNMINYLDVHRDPIDPALQEDVAEDDEEITDTPEDAPVE